MRLWSIHPKYLDSKGLVALWREALLAKKVLTGKTKGYKNHPQLDRFKQCPRPVPAIDSYLLAVLRESEKRGYCFDARKISRAVPKTHLVKVARGQIAFEFRHLLKKLKTRDCQRYRDLLAAKKILPHPLFKVIKGLMEPWEKSHSR
ncbi:MAG TPA: pyrimidine dimer DNA glycosylase/endonuclease V [Candidatus Omnitrophota bacterium]|nr:pyrimidine dimer DNA glycosylase/endonuclease V [Candidatus Omnitrophota bacterium]HPD84890.1 pyrimidine dimer DNA glycosylase/endonuclease V [Candidatus Omnitrophota bacterium]HRZ03748.1 pyrimidine dimer DNA glycosylase/endonuclease V [Candidatus Omnitrophota bacterium]